VNQLYHIFIEPRSAQPDTRNRELVLNYMLVGLIILVAFEFVTSLFGFIFLKQHYLLLRLFSILAVMGLFSGLYWFSRQRDQQRLVSFAVIGILLMLALAVVFEWGTVTPTGILLFGLVIVMAGILLGARYALYTALLSTLLLVIFEYLKVQHIVTPNLTWMQRPSSLSDIMGFAVIYAIIALISWLYNQQMERSLERARRSEAALNRQNEQLEVTVKKRTEQLEIAQLEKLQQVYRFAELGRISSALFHDLANHLTTVSLDIEGLGSTQKTELMSRVQNDIGYIDDVVQRVRLQLRGQGSVERFNLMSEINKVVKILNYKMVQNRIDFTLHKPRKPIYFKSDVIPFRQIISNLLGNAIDASTHKNAKQRKIVVTITDQAGQTVITITDWGVGIKPQDQTKIFEPFYSSKSDGTGIGLFIVKQIVENDLGGTISVTSQPKTGTTFTVTLPHHNAAV
jgi:signal transduction histidine kinase